MSNVLWSINIMIAILLIGVGYVIYWIFMYDTWYPNEQRMENSSLRDASGEITGETEGTH